MTLPRGLGSLGVDAPLLLALLAGIPILLALARGRPGGLPAALCRSAALGALAATLAGAYLERQVPAAGVCLVAAVDVSRSVGGAARTEAERFLAALGPRLRERDRLGVLVFAGAPRLVAPPGPAAAALARLRRLGDTDDLEPDETHLAAAHTLAVSLCPPADERGVLLFTDGNETIGTIAAATALDTTGTPVFAIVPPAAALPTVALRRVLAPTTAPAGSIVSITAVVDARRDTAAAVQVSTDALAALPVPTTLRAGSNLLTLAHRVTAAGPRLLETRLLLAPDEPPPPGPVARVVTVTRPLAVLLVSERPAPVVATALGARGIATSVVTPAAFADRATRLDEQHVVVLDDVGSRDLSPRALERLTRWVADGGGLVVSGGAHTFGDHGFVGSALERMLPVELRSQAPAPREREPIALYLLIDRSNSMGYASSHPSIGYGDKMEYAKRAALAVLEQLGAADLAGAIAFDSQPYVLGRLAAAPHRGALAERIRALRYGGGTDFKAALETALGDLLESERRVRHVILLTDGDTNRRADDHAQLIAAFARAEITITAIRIGRDTVNLDLLLAISRMTGGEFHHVENVRALPQLMIRDTQRRLDRAANRLDGVARLTTPGSLLAGFTEAALPPVARWAVTHPKPEAEVRIHVEVDGRRDPVLATWQHGLGRVAVLPLEFHSGAAGWVAWSGFGRLWAQLVGWAAPAALASESRLTAERVDSRVRLTLTTGRDGTGPYIVTLPAGAPLVLRPAGARRFIGYTSDLPPGLHHLTLTGPRRAEPLELLLPAPGTQGHEQRALTPNLALLERVARDTRGVVAPTPTDVLRARPGVTRERTSLAGMLIPLALTLLLVDVALRLPSLTH